jgi:hypothetical protein
VAAAPSVVVLPWKDQAVQLAAEIAKKLKVPFRHRNDKPESRKKGSSKFQPIPETFSESFTQHQRPFKARGVTSGDAPIEYILTGDRTTKSTKKRTSFYDAEAEEQHRRAALGEMLNEDPVPLTTPGELELFIHLHNKMIYPNGKTDKPLPVDFKELTEQFNRSVVEKWLGDATLRSVFKLKTEALLRIVYDRAAEASMCKELIKPKLDLLKSLREKLKDSSGFTFPDILPRVVVETDVAAVVVNNPVVVNPVNIPLNDGNQPIAQNLPTFINLRKYTLPSNATSLQLQQLITERLEIIDNTRWCPLCKKRVQVFVDGQWELSNNLHQIEIGTKCGRRELYPTCNECDDRAPNKQEKKAEQDRKRQEKKKLKIQCHQYQEKLTPKLKNFS